MMLRVLSLFFASLLLSAVPLEMVVAEQIVIDENTEGSVVAGDFHCSPCYSPILSDAGSVDIATNSLTTGELYQYFKSRGITKLDRLSFQVDVDCDPDNAESVSLTDLSFQIQDAARTLITNADFGDSELLLDKSEITSFKPEAVLEVDLGYDFMQRFSSDSKEAVKINFSSPNDSADTMTRIVLTSNISSFSPLNLARIGGFVAFWGLIFFGAHIVSRKPDEDDSDSSNQVTLTANASVRAVSPRSR